MPKPCQKCGTAINETAGFCFKCGAQQSRLTGDTFDAPDEPGEKEINSCASFTSTDVIDEINPFQLLIDQTMTAVKNIKNAFKDVKRLIPAIILSAIWMLLILLPRLGINNFAVKALSYLTFAQGGVSNSFVRMLGGIVGKVVYAYLVTTIAVSAANGKSPLANFSEGLKQSLTQYRNSASNLPMLLSGTGAAFIAFNFMSGFSSAWKSMAAIAALFLTIRSMGSMGGFFIKFIGSIISKTKEAAIKKLKIQAFTAGMAAGFALSVIVSFIRGVYLCYIVGIVLLLTALIIHFAYKPNKEARPA